MARHKLYLPRLGQHRQAPAKHDSLVADWLIKTGARSGDLRSMRLLDFLDWAAQYARAGDYAKRGPQPAERGEEEK